jgi:choline dehydrogenase-like flavoprotein
MEGGGFEPTEGSQALYQGELRGLPYPIEGSRLRYLGGASNHWAGETRPLDARDFEPLPHHPMNEWPIRKGDLDAYTQETAEILDLPDARTPYDMFGEDEHALLPIAWRLSPPTRFRTKYRQALVKSPHIWLCVQANLVDIEVEPGLDSVSSFVFSSEADTEPFRLRARRFVICCGGLENARVLLLANRQLPHGIGNRHDLVGRFFCEHLAVVVVGHAVLRPGRVEHCSVFPSDNLIMRRRCLSFFVAIVPFKAEERSSADHVICALPFRDEIGRAVLGRSPVCFDAEVSVVIQQACNPESRVTLSDRKDRLGLRRLVLDWRLTDLDHHTIRTAALEMGRALAQHDIGRLRLAGFVERSEAPPEDLVQGQNHHMCTTRMSASPSTGVVDANCRVHGMENLYIGGSSVFASAGVSNPTHTIVQLALRLADHLNEQL